MLPSTYSLPPKFTSYRPGQLKALERIAKTDKKYILLQGPTGSGKSLVGATLQRMLQTRVLYLVKTLQLEEQLKSDFPYAELLKGRANYPTYMRGSEFPAINASLCTRNRRGQVHCVWCCTKDETPEDEGKCTAYKECPYYVAKVRALRADLAITNLALFLNEANYVGGLSGFPWVCLDECVPAGTQIATPQGDKPIEEIKVGDYIWGYKDGHIMPTRVEATTSRLTSEPFFRIDNLSLTGNHPVWTADKSYKPAAHVSCLDNIAVICYNKGHVQPELRILQPGVLGHEPPEHPRETTAVLQPTMFFSKQERPVRSLYSYLQAMQATVSGSGRKETTDFLFHTLSRTLDYQSGIVQTYHHPLSSCAQATRGTTQATRVPSLRPESYLQSQSQSEEPHHTTPERLPEPQWWYGPTFASPTTATSSPLRLAGGICSFDRCAKKEGLAILLQHRHSRTYPEDCYRGRWGQPSFAAYQDEGRSQRHLLDLSGMDGSQVSQRDGAEEPRRSCFSGPSGRKVYNLKTSSGNYFASGVLVHNCDLLEESLMSFSEFRVTQRWINRLKLPPPDRKTREEAWVRWASQVARPKLEERLRELQSQWGIESIKEEEEITRGLEKLDFFLRDIETNPWVYTQEQNAYVFKPVFVSKQAQDLVWRHAERFLCMSATVIDPKQMCRDLGIPQEEAEFIDLKSEFDARRRPVFYNPVVTMSHKTKDTAWRLMAKGVDKALDKYTTQKVLIHTVSTDLAMYIVKNSRHASRIITYGNGVRREDALRLFTQSKESKVLVAQSMERGVDLFDDLCRVILIVKVPYLNLGDKQIAKRLYSSRDGQRWYQVQTWRTLIQMTGRGVRHDKDWAITEILDAEFGEFYRKTKRMAPVWWKESLRGIS